MISNTVVHIGKCERYNKRIKRVLKWKFRNTVNNDKNKIKTIFKMIAWLSACWKMEEMEVIMTGDRRKTFRLCFVCFWVCFKPVVYCPVLYCTCTVQTYANNLNANRWVLPSNLTPPSNCNVCPQLENRLHRFLPSSLF